MRHRLRALVAVGLLLAFYVVALAMIAAFLFSAGVLVRVAPLAATVPGAVALILAVALARATFARPGRQEDGIVVSRADEPALWAEVEQLATATGTEPPDEIRLVAEANAGVREEVRLLGLVRGTRRMYVGAPLLLALSPAEMRFVLAHELGHYSGKHTALAPLVYRGQEAIGRAVLELGARTLLGRLLNAYGAVYVKVASSVNRAQEFEADTSAARLTHPGAARSALEVMHPLVVAWQHFASQFATMGRDDGFRPTPLFRGLDELLAHPDLIVELVRVADEATESPSPYDSHPPTSERVARLAALGANDEGSRLAPAGPLGPSPASIARLEEALFEGSTLTPVAWDEAVRIQADRDLTTSSLELARLLRLAGNPDPRTGDAVRRFAHVRRIGLIDGCSVDDERAMVAGLVADSVAIGLVGAGTAELHVDWLTRYRLTDRDGRPIDPWLTAREAAADHDPAALVAWATARGVDLDLRLDDLERPAEALWQQAAAVHGIVAPAVTMITWRALVVTGGGILAVPLERPEWVALAHSNVYFRWGWRNSVAQVLLRLAGTPPAALALDPRTVAIPWRRIARAELRPNLLRPLWGTRLTVTMTDGSHHRYNVHPAAGDLGRPWDAVEDHLGDRFVRRGRAAHTWPSRPAAPRD